MVKPQSSTIRQKQCQTFDHCRLPIIVNEIPPGIKGAEITSRRFVASLNSRMPGTGAIADASDHWPESTEA
jgi:hypothetical protein